MIIKLADVLYIIACVIAAITIAHTFSDYFSRGVLVPQPLLGALVLFLIGLGLRLAHDTCRRGGGEAPRRERGESGDCGTLAR